MATRSMRVPLASFASGFSWAGKGYFAGEAPSPDDPEQADGRFRILNVPARGRVAVLERQSLRVLATTMSAADGTWRIDRINPDYTCFVIGFDEKSGVNAAIQDRVKPATIS